MGTVSRADCTPVSSKRWRAKLLIVAISIPVILGYWTDAASNGNGANSVIARPAASTPPRAITALPLAASCSATQGTLLLRAGAVRVSGISPLTVFFDATGTSSGATESPFRHIFYEWNFGDQGESGSEPWAFGSNPGRNSMNAATGAVAAHTYVTLQSDKSYEVSVKAYDGTNLATCRLNVTAYAPSGANGFPGHATTCTYNSTEGEGCPPGARAVSALRLERLLDANVIGSGKRLLFKCGDTFTASSAVAITGTKWSVGAYGPCVGKTIGRPVLLGLAKADLIDVDAAAVDGRFADVELNGSENGVVGLGTAGDQNRSQAKSITILNVDAQGFGTSFGWNGGRYALVNSTSSKPAGNCAVGVFVNYGAGISLGGGGVNDMDYQAVMGNRVNLGNGAACQAMRVSLMRLGVIENNTLQGAGKSFANLKLHNGSDRGVWQGIYSELDVISDNTFGDATGNVNLVEIAPQNDQSDERIRNIIVERNLFIAGANTQDNLRLSARDVTVADNIFRIESNQYALLSEQRGIEPAPAENEIYNNTFYAASYAGPSPGFAVYLAPSVSDTRVANNLCQYREVRTRSVCAGSSGTNNVIGSNSQDADANPQFAGQPLHEAADFKPTAKSGGAEAVPIWSDFFGNRWQPTWSLGAIHP